MRIITILLAFICLLPLQAYSQNENDIVVVTAPSGASLREEPKTTGKKIAVIPYMTEVKFLQYSEEETTIDKVTARWNRISWDGKEGYVFGALTCSTPEEMKTIKAADGKVKRDMHRLLLTCDDGSVVTVEDQPVDGENFLKNTFAGYLHNRAFYLVEQIGWEWGNPLLISTRDGRQLEIDAEPVFSPDGKRFVTVNIDLEAGYSPNRIKVYDIVDGTGVQAFINESEDWGPVSAEWLSNDKIKIRRRDQANVESECTLERSTATGKWQLNL